MSGSQKHKHCFTSLWSGYGVVGQEVQHIHPCVAGDGGCSRVVMGDGVNCGGKRAPHRRMTLTLNGPKSRTTCWSDTHLPWETEDAAA